eukprot:TRINITY_DN610_c3_g1_i1.p3 TRINITY_DN610_c3_g1~~TRINITY_DN610_c3_g1_i1.p3  ORF type:complete len:200 (+),score=23.77 TRINITY_DN610_c3_g1_i1:1157-1756(+)
MPRRSIWKGSFVDAFLLRIQKKRESLLSRSSTTHYYTEILLSVISVLFPLWVYAGIYQLLDFLGLSIPIPIIIVAACEDKEEEDNIDLDLRLAPPSPPLSEEEEQDLLTKRGEVKEELRALLRIGYLRKARYEKTIEKMARDIGIDQERDKSFLEELRNHFFELANDLSRGGEQPKRFDKKAMNELLRWISEKKGRKTE